MVIRPTRHKVSHFGDVPQANLLAWCGIKLNLTQQMHTFSNQKKCTTTQNKHKKLKPCLVAPDIRPGNGEGLFLFRRFINLSLTYLLTYTLTLYLHITARDPHTAIACSMLILTVCPSCLSHSSSVFKRLMLSSSFSPHLTSTIFSHKTSWRNSDCEIPTSTSASNTGGV